MIYQEIYENKGYSRIKWCGSCILLSSKKVMWFPFNSALRVSENGKRGRFRTSSDCFRTAPPPNPPCFSHSLIYRTTSTLSVCIWFSFSEMVPLSSSCRCWFIKHFRNRLIAGKGQGFTRVLSSTTPVID